MILEIVDAKCLLHAAKDLLPVLHPSVDLKDSTNCVGSFLINPTVSVSRKGRLLITTFTNRRIQSGKKFIFSKDLALTYHVH